jgi:hypothetical protein
VTFNFSSRVKMIRIWRAARSSLQHSDRKDLFQRDARLLVSPLITELILGLIPGVFSEKRSERPIRADLKVVYKR